MLKSKKLKFKKLPYEASYKTLLKRFPEINIDQDDDLGDETFHKAMNGAKPYWVDINGHFYERYGLCWDNDCPVAGYSHIVWGSDNRDSHVQICAKFIYLITEHFKDCHFITPRDIVDWGVAHKPISDEERYWTDYYENIGK